MPIAGIITEYNPLHPGHVYLLRETRRLLGPDCAVVCAMSGNFVQRGDLALVGKRARAIAAVQSGADLVLELPLPWAVSSAEAFAEGGVQVLEATGVVDALVFGSESGDTGSVERLAAAMLSEDFPVFLKQELKQGGSYAAACQRAAAHLLSGEEEALLEGANDTLAVEYCKSLLRLNSRIRPLAVRRTGAGHNDLSAKASLPSATALRALVRQGNQAQALDRMAPAMAEAFRAEAAAGRAPVFMETCQRAVLARLRSMEREDFAALDQGREGLGNRLYHASREAASLEEILALAKTKRYTHARLRRMALWAWLGLAPASFPEAVPYLRPLAANGTGRAILARMRKTAALPILTKPGQLRQMGPEARRLFALEARGADLYALAYPELSAARGGAAWREGPAMLS